MGGRTRVQGYCWTISLPPIRTPLANWIPSEHIMSMCVFAMYTVSILLDWRLYEGAGLLWRESFRQHPLPPILKVVRLCSASKVLVAFFIFWGSRGRVRTTPTLNFGGRARVLLNWFRQPTKQSSFVVFLHTGAKIQGSRNLCSVPYRT